MLYNIIYYVHIIYVSCKVYLMELLGQSLPPVCHTFLATLITRQNSGLTLHE